MNICFLTPSDRTDKIPPPLIRPKKTEYHDDRSTISINQFNMLPANKKAGFLLLPEKHIYVKKFSLAESALRRAAAHRLVEASKSPTSPESEFNTAIGRFNFEF